MKQAILLTAVLGSLFSAPALAEGDPAAGAKVFRRCATCHAVEEGKKKIGPSLYGVFGRTSGTLEGFKYSDAMASAGITWSEETISEYITNPRAYVPGNRMVFPGLRNPKQREDVIAYLKSVTGAE